MSNDKLRLGKLGEQLAGNYLKNKGYKIIAQNYHTREGEIDLICRKDKVFYFIEVKTRTNQAFGWPEEAVTDQKLEKISLAAEKYLIEKQINSEWQIDIISINLNQTGKETKIKHYKNITIY